MIFCIFLIHIYDNLQRYIYARSSNIASEDEFDEREKSNPAESSQNDNYKTWSGFPVRMQLKEILNLFLTWNEQTAIHNAFVWEYINGVSDASWTFLSSTVYKETYAFRPKFWGIDKITDVPIKSIIEINVWNEISLLRLDFITLRHY